MEKLSILIPERMLGLRLDVALSEILPNQSHSKITAWIRLGGALMVEGQGFEPWKGISPCWFSRPVHSAALPSLRKIGMIQFLSIK